MPQLAAVAIVVTTATAGVTAAYLWCRDDARRIRAHRLLTMLFRQDWSTDQDEWEPGPARRRGAPTER